MRSTKLCANYFRTEPSREIEDDSRQPYIVPTSGSLANKSSRYYQSHDTALVKFLRTGTNQSEWKLVTKCEPHRTAEKLEAMILEATIFLHSDQLCIYQIFRHPIYVEQNGSCTIER